MTVLTCTSTRQSITLLGEPIADSGEGKVWRTNHNGYLAKIYHSPNPERVQKLAVMIAHRPKEQNSHLNHISFAWPKSVLKDAHGDCVGFLMPEIKEAKQLIDVYNPKKRKALKLDVDWRFFHTTALNIASIIEAIHISGYVLGDIKPQNILVNDRALPSIIDTDSFQVRNPKNNKVYRCLVGSEGFTPPELIDKDFSSIDQTEVHDRFRLAVIIYQLLFGGQTPFAGKWTVTGETPETNELIRQGLWLYAPNGLMQPVERTIPLEIVHPEVQRCFLRCFNDGYKNPNLRPTAGDWVKALRLAVNELTICGKVDSHYYSRTYGKCYWCDRSTKLGIDIFPGFARPKQQSAFPVSTLQPKVFAADKSLENVAIGGQIHTLQGHSNSVYCVAYSPDGKTLATGSHDKTIKLWDVGTGREIYTLHGHFDSVYCVAYSPDGKTLATGSDDKTIKLWDVTTGGQILTIQAHFEWVRSVAFSPDGKTLASGSYDKTIKLWDVTTGGQIRTLQGHSHSVYSVAYSPDGRTLASGSYDSTIKLWDVTTGGQILTIQAHSGWVLRSVTFSPDGRTLATGSDDKTIKLWDVTTGGQIRTIQAHSNLVYSVAFSPDGKTLASGSYGDIKLWDVGMAREIYNVKGHSDWVRSVAFSPDGKILASGSYDKTINIWQLSSLSNIATSSSVQHTQSQVSQSSISMVVLWSFFLVWSILLCFTSVVSGFVGGFLVGAIGIGCCWRFYRWFWRFS
ncbi:protein kinase domain-containing protein [Nostoc sp.]|uniref:WD40 domain-containing protein n=1 Tax=Nostoc sp. TaxID=1180 RepID=UPI002FFAAE3A